MPDVTTYISTYPAIPGISQAAFIARIIDEKPSVITIFDRNGAAVAGTQTVRIEPVSNLVRNQEGVNVVTEEEYVMIHAAAGANIQKGDRFTADNFDGTYDVINIVEAFADRLLFMAQVK